MGLFEVIDNQFRGFLKGEVIDVADEAEDRIQTALKCGRLAPILGEAVEQAADFVVDGVRDAEDAALHFLGLDDVEPDEELPEPEAEPKRGPGRPRKT